MPAKVKKIVNITLILIASLGFIFYSPAFAHTGSEDANATVKATIVDPDIFVAKALLPIFLEVKDKNTDKKITGLKPLIEITNSSDRKIAVLEAGKKGENYLFEYKFPESGDYTIHARFDYKDKTEKVDFKIFVSEPISETPVAVIIIFIIGGLLLLLTIILGIKNKKIKPTIVWAIIIIIATLLAYSVFITLEANPSLGIVTCPAEGTCWWTAHIHAFIPVSVCGDDIRLPIEVGRLDHPHTHEEKNIIHWHDKLPYDRETQKITNTKPLTIGAFFDAIEINFERDVYNDKKNGDLCPDGKAGNLKVFANGKILNDPRNFIWKDKDVIMIFFDARTEQKIEQEIKNNPVNFPALGRG